MAQAARKSNQPELFEMSGFVAHTVMVNYAGKVEIDLDANPDIVPLLRPDTDIEITVKGRVRSNKIDVPEGKAVQGQIVIDTAGVYIAGRDFLTTSAAAAQRRAERASERAKKDVFNADNFNVVDEGPSNVVSINGDSAVSGDTVESDVEFPD